MSSKNSKALPGILYIPAFSADYHTLSSRQMIAHELAHLAEDPNSHPSMIWREARADTLSYLVTGKADIEFPPGLSIEKMDKNGKITQHHEKVLRSMQNPSVSKISEVVPSVQAQHYNSQIISSLLYDLSKQLGKEQVADFVRWMDSQRANLIPRLALKTEETEAEPNVVLVDPDNLNEVRSAIQGNLIQFGAKVREWAQERQLDKSTQTWIVEQLRAKGIDGRTRKSIR